LKEAGVDTIVVIELREFGPQLILSIPVLWSSKTDVDFTMSVLDMPSAKTLMVVSHHRKEGGPFAVRTVQMVGKELEAALRSLLYAKFESFESGS
jgi:hypothetical protein